MNFDSKAFKSDREKEKKCSHNPKLSNEWQVLVSCFKNVFFFLTLFAVKSTALAACTGRVNVEFGVSESFDGKCRLFVDKPTIASQGTQEFNFLIFCYFLAQQFYRSIKFPKYLLCRVTLIKNSHFISLSLHNKMHQLNFFRIFWILISLYEFQNVNELPSYENAAGDLDNLDDLLQYIGHTR